MVGRAPAFTAEAFTEAGSSAHGDSAFSRGLSLERLLELAPLTPEQGAAVSIAVLHQLAVGSAQPSALVPRNVRILPEGEIAIALQRGAGPAPDGQRELLMAAGRLACAALGVDVDPDPNQGFTAAETVALALVVFVRALAVGALGTDLVSAARLCAERAGRFGSAERLACSREELGALVTRLLQTPGATPPAAVRGPMPPAQTLPRRSRSSKGPAALLVGASALLLFAAAFGATVGVGVLGPHASGSTPTRPISSPAAVSPPAPAAAPSPLQTPLTLPVYAPPAAGAIRSVQGQLVGPCQSGGRCSMDVAVSFQSRPSALPLAWKFEVVDRCSGAAVELPGGVFTAPAGWNHILIRTPLQMPQTSAPAIVVVTTAPAAAESPWISTAAPACGG
jgi:hypothetical protein